MEREVLEVRKRVLGPEHTDTLTTSDNLAISLSEQGKYAEAEQMQREVHAVQKRVLGAKHPHTLMTARNLAASRAEQGRHVEGVEGAAEAAGGAGVGEREMEAAVEEGAENEEHAVRKREREGTQGSRTLADTGSKRKKQ